MQNGLVLPHKGMTGHPSGMGCVCDSEWNFVAGHIRLQEIDDKHGNIVNAYEIPKSVKSVPDTVVYGGILANNAHRLVPVKPRLRVPYLKRRSQNE